MSGTWKQGSPLCTASETAQGGESCPAMPQRSGIGTGILSSHRQRGASRCPPPFGETRCGHPSPDLPRSASSHCWLRDSSSHFVASRGLRRKLRRKLCRVESVQQGNGCSPITDSKSRRFNPPQLPPFGPSAQTKIHLRFVFAVGLSFACSAGPRSSGGAPCL